MNTPTNDNAGECSPASPCSEFLWAYHNDRTVHVMSRQNEPLEKIVGVLAKEKQALQQRLLELEISRATHRVIIPNVQAMASAETQTPPKETTL
jgi:hypothetical protein